MPSRRLARPRPWEHPSYYPVGALLAALHADLGWPTETGLRGPVAKALSKVVPTRHFVPRAGLTLLPMMGPVWHTALPWAWRDNLILYCWDVWASNVDEWAETLGGLRLAAVVATSTAATEALSARLPQTPVRYIPEAAEVDSFSNARPLVQRSIHVLELGRRHEVWHAAVVTKLAGYSHLFQRAAGELVFPSREAMHEGLANTAVSVCLPRSLTHPDDAGAFTAITHRYFESMAAGCLLLGHCPEDLHDLFGYNPVIEIDWNRPAAQVLEILRSLDAFQELVHRNLATVQRLGVWEARLPAFRSVVAQCEASLSGTGHARRE